MKIAFFSDTFLPQLNGVATSLANQARQLGEEGHELIIFTPKLDDIKREKFKAKNVNVIHLPTVPTLLYPEFKLGILGLPKVLKYLLKFDPDIIHLYSPLTIGMDAVVASKILKKPLVGTIHIYFADLDYLRGIKYKFAVKLLNKVSPPYLNFLYGQCDLLLAPSKLLIEELQKNGFKKPILYFPNGVMIKNHHLLSAKEKGLLKKKYGLKEKIVLHFGRLSDEKNIDVLIKAFYELTKRHPNVSLLIIGDGPATKRLKKLVQELQIEKDIVFTGFIDHPALLSSNLLGLADLFATASTSENQPMAILEAMMFGLPIIGVREAGLIEMVLSNGYLVQPGDTKDLAEKIEKVLFDQKIASQFRNNSLQLIGNFSVEKTTDKLLNLYQTLISNTKRG